MGAGKSKPGPIIESARTVIARRKKESTTIVIDTIDASVNEVVNAGSTHADSTLAQRPSGIAPASGAEYSPEVLNSMTNWGNYVTTSYYKNPTLKGEKIEMASTVRHAEDKLNIKPNKSIPGRLTEDQITQIFSDLRHTEKRFLAIASEFLIEESDVRQMSQIARIPVSYNDKETQELMAR